MKGFKFRPVIRFHGHSAVRILKRATPALTQEIRLYGHLRGSVTLTPGAKLDTCYYALGLMRQRVELHDK